MVYKNRTITFYISAISMVQDAGYQVNHHFTLLSVENGYTNPERFLNEIAKSK
jgi:hypothetical protein